MIAHCKTHRGPRFRGAFLLPGLIHLRPGRTPRPPVWKINSARRVKETEGSSASATTYPGSRPCQPSSPFRRFDYRPTPIGIEVVGHYERAALASSIKLHAP